MSRETGFNTLISQTRQSFVFEKKSVFLGKPSDGCEALSLLFIQI